MGDQLYRYDWPTADVSTTAPSMYFSPSQPLVDTASSDPLLLQLSSSNQQYQSPNQISYATDDMREPASPSFQAFDSMDASSQMSGNDSNNAGLPDVSAPPLPAASNAGASFAPPMYYDLVPSNYCHVRDQQRMVECKAKESHALFEAESLSSGQQAVLQQEALEKRQQQPQQIPQQYVLRQQPPFPLVSQQQHQLQQQFNSLPPAQFSSYAQHQQRLQQHASSQQLQLQQQFPSRNYAPGSYNHSNPSPSSRVPLALSSHAFPPTISAEQANASMSTGHNTATQQNNQIPNRPPLDHATTPPLAINVRSTHVHTNATSPLAIGSMSPASHDGYLDTISSGASPVGRRSPVMSIPSALVGTRKVVRSTSNNALSSTGLSPSGSLSRNVSTGNAASMPPPPVLTRPSSGLKRKSSLNAGAGGGESNNDPPTPSAGSKKGMGRKSKSDANLMTAAERKQRRLQRKAELARVSRRKKKQGLAEMEARLKELKDAIGSLEGGEGGLISPSASMSNLRLTPSSSGTSLAALGDSSHPSHKRVRRESGSVLRRTDEGAEDEDEDGDGNEDEDDSEMSDNSEDSDDDDDSQEDSDFEHTNENTPQLSSRALPPSTSMPHLAALSATPINSSHGSPATLSRQVSANSSLNVSGTADSDAPTTSASATAFDPQQFLPTFTTIPRLPETPHSSWMGYLSRASLPILHRGVQDSLRGIEQALRLDPFEKLLRWVVQQAALASNNAPNATNSVPPQTPAQAAQSAQAWSYLSSQLDVNPTQTGSLASFFESHHALHADLASLREEIVALSAELRAHASQADSFQSELDRLLRQDEKDALGRWLSSPENARWVAEEMAHPRKRSLIGSNLSLLSPSLMLDASGMPLLSDHDFNDPSSSTMMGGFQTFPSLPSVPAASASIMMGGDLDAAMGDNTTSASILPVMTALPSIAISSSPSLQAVTIGHSNSLLHNAQVVPAQLVIQSNGGMGLLSDIFDPDEEHLHHGN